LRLPPGIVVVCSRGSRVKNEKLRRKRIETIFALFNMPTGASEHTFCAAFKLINAQSQSTAAVCRWNWCGARRVQKQLRVPNASIYYSIDYTLLNLFVLPRNFNLQQ
jgi:hypothetical protein